jgi:hypothetical protein
LFKVATLEHVRIQIPEIEKKSKTPGRGMENRGEEWEGERGGKRR